MKNATVSEPAAIGTIVAAAINAIVLFALKHELDPDVQSAIVLIVTMIAGLFIRSKVTPVA
jgi:hypothetical protein